MGGENSIVVGGKSAKYKKLVQIKIQIINSKMSSNKE